MKQISNVHLHYYKKRIFFLLIFTFFFNSIWGQIEENDSLMRKVSILEMYADSCMSAGDATSALDAFSKSAEIRKVVQGVENEDYVSNIVKIMVCYANLKNFDNAVRVGTEASYLIKRVMGVDHPSYAILLSLLSGYYYLLNDYSEAIRLGTEAMELIRKLFGEENPQYATTLTILAASFNIIENYNEAIKLMNEALDIQKRVLGSDHPDYIKSLNQLSSYYFSCGNYLGAISFKREETRLQKIVLGIKHPDYIASSECLERYLSLFATEKDSLGNYSEAIKYKTEAKDIIKELRGVDHPDYKDCLDFIARYNASFGDYHEAIRLESEVVELSKKTLGVNHSDYASSLCLLAQYYSCLGNYNEALRLGAEGMGIIKKNEGEGSSIYLSCLNDIASYKASLGKYMEAITMLTEAMAIKKKLQGTENLTYVKSLNNLANVYCILGNYNESIKLGNEALEIEKKVLGDDHPVYASSLDNLANSYNGIGDYTEAIRLGTKALVIREKVLGVNHPDYAGSLYNLANFNSHLGNYTEAIRLGAKALVIREKVLGINHPDYASSLSLLAINNLDLGNYTEAIRLETDALEIRKRVNGVNHPNYAGSLNNLAIYISHLGNYTEAIRLLTEASEIEKKVFGVNHPDYASSLDNLAGCYYHLGNYAKAVKLETEVTKIRINNLGREHPDYEASLYNLAVFNLSLCNNHMAKNDFITAFEVKANNLTRSFSELSSFRRKKYWEKEKKFFLCELPKYVLKMADKALIALLYDKSALLAKGILLNTEIEMKKMIEESGDSTLVEEYQNIQINREIINKQSTLPISARYLDIDSINQIIEKQEDELTNKSKAYGDYMRNLRLTWKDVRQVLDDKDIAIEFLDFPITKDSVMYIALTLKKGYDCPRMIPLFELSQLREIHKNDLYKSTQLTKLLWKPLKEELEGINNVYFSPSGELHKIGIEYLPLNGDEFIFDKYQLYRLSSTRQIVLEKKSTHKQATLYGGIDYDFSSITMNSTNIKDTFDIIVPRVERMNVDSLSVRGSRGYLLGTKIEADIISANLKKHSWNCQYFTGNNGTEENFKAMSGNSPSLLHIATHGFYMTENDARKEQEIAIIESKRFINKHHSLREDKPMTRSGLLLAGCNHALNHEPTPENSEDGILTAQEIASLDFRGLDLVVLSACETGLGDISSGEGVFGLQRGFKKAGANTIIMSLWKVPDRATERLMTSFYQYYLDGMSKYKAFTTAREQLRKECPPRQNKPDWAAFIMLDGLN